MIYRAWIELETSIGHYSTEYLFRSSRNHKVPRWDHFRADLLKNFYTELNRRLSSKGYDLAHPITIDHVPPPNPVFLHERRHHDHHHPDCVYPLYLFHGHILIISDAIRSCGWATLHYPTQHSHCLLDMAPSTPI
jgi:hypothetical protein